jgi:hypothetical protein
MTHRDPRIARAGAVLAAALLMGAALPAAAAVDTQPPQTVPEKAGPPAQSLSEQLDRSHGIIHPPADLDAGMAQPPPVTGRGIMPIVPPPGTPGGNPKIEPK